MIELPLDKVFDLNGWDLIKAVRLLVKGNATVGEWLRSPVVYRGDADFRDAFLVLADRTFDADRLRAHHLHVGRLQLGSANDGRLKPRMYALRAAASLRWLREHVDAGVPPMDLPTLVEQTEVSVGFRAQVADLIELKRQTREAAPGDVPAEIEAFILSEFEAADAALDRAGAPSDRAEARELATAFFRDWIGPVGRRLA